MKSNAFIMHPFGMEFLPWRYDLIATMINSKIIKRRINSVKVNHLRRV
nr:MAG TPA: hypothetical protein [Caudoviricetes sp.]